jgi:predicted ATPase/class 3 adenylate cyclase
MPNLPSGTVTFLFSDIEGSTRILQELGEGYARLLEEHRLLMRTAIAANGGYVIDNAGDSFFAAFPRATGAVCSAVAAQCALAMHEWPPGCDVRVRMGLHTGEPTITAEGYAGLDVHRAARICAAAHGGQTLLSHSTQQLVATDLPDQVSSADMGEHRLKDLLHPEHLYQLRIGGLETDFPPLRTLSSRPNNLPGQPTPLIGRDRELGEIIALLARPEVRLITLSGPGGTGKTRLSVQVAASVLDDFDAAYVVQLAPITDPDLIAPTIASTINARENPMLSTIENIREHIGDRRMLFVLDNFEQIVAGASSIAELLSACPGVSAIVTSRIVLHIRGEYEYAVPPLALPNRHEQSCAALSQYSAVELFAQRARAAKPDFTINDENAPAVAEICFRLDGLPLAIELAAARIKLFSPQAILTRLSKPLELLRGGARDLPDRHQTLRQAIAWSYDLLDASEKTLFRRLSAFVGGCTLDAAEALCERLGGDIDSFDGVTALADKSLLRQQEGRDGEPRFFMLETIREFGLGLLAELGEETTVRRAHAELVLAMVKEGEPSLTGKDQLVWLNRFEDDHDNIRGAIAWSIENAPEIGQEIAGRVWRFWIIRGHANEARHILARLIALGNRSGEDGAIWAKVLQGAGTIEQEQGYFAKALEFFEPNLEYARTTGDRYQLALTLNSLGWIYWQAGEHERSCALSREALVIHTEIGDKRGIATSLANLGTSTGFQGHYAESRATLERALGIRRELGEARGIGYAHASLGFMSVWIGDCDAARASLRTAFDIVAPLGDKQILAFCHTGFGFTEIVAGNLGACAPHFETSLPLWRETGNRWGVCNALVGLGVGAHANGDYHLARQLLDEGYALSTAMRNYWTIILGKLYLGLILLEQGELLQARAAFENALDTATRSANPGGSLEACLGLATSLLRLGESADESVGEANRLFLELGLPPTPLQRKFYGAALELCTLPGTIAAVPAPEMP